jgi:hypothetical protein
MVVGTKSKRPQSSAPSRVDRLRDSARDKPDANQDINMSSVTDVRNINAKPCLEPPVDLVSTNDRDSIDIRLISELSEAIERGLDRGVTHAGMAYWLRTQADIVERMASARIAPSLPAKDTAEPPA